MVLNYVWISFFLIAFVVAVIKSVNAGNIEMFSTIVESMLKTSKVAIVDIGIPLAGGMIFFLGLMNIAKEAGAIRFLAKLLNPLLKRLFPGIPDKHEAMGEMVMNFSANMLGLDNAATPFGLKAMRSLESLNPQPGTASNAQIMFLVLHTSGLTLIPLSIITYRFTAGSQDVACVFIPCVLATLCGTLASMIIVGIKQRIRFDAVLISWIVGILVFVVGTMFGIQHLSVEARDHVTKHSGNVILLLLVVTILLAGMRKKLNVFDTFINGAKEGWEIVIKIMPYLVGMLVSIAAFRECGALSYMSEAVKSVMLAMHLDTKFVDALPVAIMKPFSGSGSRGLLLDIFDVTKNPTLGPDSFAGKLGSIFMGSADTTFYIIALYFGSVGIKNVRYAVWAGLMADFIGVLAAIWIGYIFFG